MEYKGIKRLHELVKEYHYDPEEHLYVFVHWDDLPEFVKLIEGSGDNDSGCEFQNVQVTRTADICFYNFDYNLEYFDLDANEIFPKNEE